ncbi:HlyD family type I secretion periplasmic adaptor subunit [Sneathiella sp. P13V-1]|uniref:HlyD family type I secretion periplasmic adaptor subunit n=1 Tax=Sneathiella sp. P13V-1 TaxID=2697366 RepID=UPI00187B6E65|nr:HlyD family type I secretion periplasmic adaptor subunit [Sneathiella sp. P13V-1]MBE7636409.1 HlyD family type I secretion periplasmic adaptor subunit [Sneathiella sp. P13V-1]
MVPQSGLAKDKIGIGKPVFFGVLVIALFFGGLGGWAALAPLGSAAIAQGTVSVEGSRKTVQHLEGGIVAEILVKDGDQVKKGEPLLRLERTQAEASLKLIYGRKMITLAEIARLTAEQNGDATLVFPKWLLDRKEDPSVQKTMESQQNIFAARLQARKSQATILQQKVAQLEEEIKGLSGQVASTREQIKLIRLELKDVEVLVKKKLAKRTRLRSLERNEAELAGRISQSVARIAQSRQAIGEIQLQIAEIDNAVLNEAVAGLRDMQAQLYDLEEQERASIDILERTEILAPTNGIIVNMQVTTTGGVISSGQELMDILPVDQKLIVEAQVDPSDIDVVNIGAQARITFPAFSQRTTSPAVGSVIGVSADSLVNERTGATYYQATVQIDNLEQANLTLDQLKPGMQADVMISTGERTALEYIMNPVIASFNRAMTEQ